MPAPLSPCTGNGAGPAPGASPCRRARGRPSLSLSLQFTLKEVKEW